MMLYGVAVLSILVLTLAVLLARRIGSGSESLPVTTAWLDDLSEDRYRPMLRLLDESDFRFLRTQAGFTPAIERKIRRERVEAFQGYLHMLESDFKRVSLALKIMVVQSECDRPDLASAIIHRQLAFACATLHVQFRLFLFQRNIASVDASQLLRMFAGLRLELKSMVPAAFPVAA